MPPPPPPSPKLWEGTSTSSCMQNLTTWSKSIETDKSCLTTVHNEYVKDWHSIEKTSPLQTVFKGVYARNRLHRLLNIPSALVGNTDPDHRMWQHWVAIYIDANTRGEYYDPTDVYRTNPLMSISWANIAFIGFTIPFEYKKKDLSCADFIAFFTSFIDVQDIAWQRSLDS